MSEVLERFEREYLEYHSIGQSRRREVLRHLTALEARTGVAIQDVPASEIRAYISDLATVLAPPTVGKILGQIRPFFQWAWEASILDASALMEVRAVRPPRGARALSQPKPYSREQVKLLWRDWDRKYALPKIVAGSSTTADLERALWFVKRWENGSTPWWRVKSLAWRFQSRAIISLAVMGALRRDEIWHLTVTDMHPEAEYVVVTSARKNPHAQVVERAVPWTTPDMRNAVRDWVDLRDRIVPGHDAAWLSMASVPHIRTPLPHRRFEMLMTTLGRGWEFHRLRHTAATEMLRAGYPLETVQKVMGHKRIQQTLAYAELLTEDVVRVAGKCEMQLSTALAAVQEAA